MPPQGTVWVGMGERARLEAAFDWADAKWREIPGLSTTDEQQTQLEKSYQAIDQAFTEQDHEKHVEALKQFTKAVEAVVSRG